MIFFSTFCKLEYPKARNIILKYMFSEAWKCSKTKFHTHNAAISGILWNKIGGNLNTFLTECIAIVWYFMYLRPRSHALVIYKWQWPSLIRTASQHPKTRRENRKFSWFHRITTIKISLTSIVDQFVINMKFIIYIIEFSIFLFLNI